MHMLTLPTPPRTADYMAPEVLRCPFKSRPDENKDNTGLQYNARVDAWAIGVLTYELLVGVPPFFDQSRTGTEDRIISAMPAFPANMSDDAKCVRGCWDDEYEMHGVEMWKSVQGESRAFGFGGGCWSHSA